VKKYISILFLFLLSAHASRSQQSELIELKEIIPYLRYDLKYASNQNFTGKKVYPKNTQSTYLVKEAAQSLKKYRERIGGKKPWTADLG
jgi:D-alanyl-D-alanine dipeptidase